MMKFKTVIIEDEALARQRLKRLLKKYEDIIQVISEADNGEKGLEIITARKPDLIFLDIQMPGLNGFEMLQYLQEIPLIIFTTAYDEYALKAFETNTVDYLLKPIAPERLEIAVNKLLTLSGKNNNLEDKIKALLDTVNPSSSYIKVKSGSVIKLINYSDICFFRAEDKYISLHTKNNKYIINDSLNCLEDKLPPFFKRIHRAAIVNIDHIKEIICLSGSKTIAVMKNKDNTEIAVSRRMKKEL